MLHELKTDPHVFQEMWDGRKNFEIRYNDRNYQVGDELILRETEYDGASMKGGMPLEYTGRRIFVDVIGVIRGPVYGLKNGWCIMSVKPV